MKPRVFIASSIEGLNVAYAVQECLEYNFETTVWPQGVFELTTSTIDALNKQTTKFDAAVFVFSPDDSAIVRHEQRPKVRDNVVFELGLFMGRLGKEKCFIVKPRSFDSAYFPTDLFGITPGTYEDSRSDGNVVAAVGSCCNQIRRALAPDTGTPVTTPNPLGDMRAFLLSQPFRLYFSPPKLSKRIVFSPDGTISEGNNMNEHRWRIIGDKLELLQLDGNVHSRFYLDASDDTFKHTGDSDTRSIRGQFIAPEVRRIEDSEGGV